MGDDMATNILKAINNIINHNDYNLNNVRILMPGDISSLNRANNMGDALEFFIKDAFCNSFNITEPEDKWDIYRQNLSFLGAKNHPPDMILINGDAVEVKKKKGLGNGELQLNSSFPKNKLYHTDPKITQECKDCEDWTEKDMIYIIGQFVQNNLKLLGIIYGDCYAARKQFYECILDKVQDGFGENFEDNSDTNEIGRLNGIDPLNITNLRVRGMWTIQNPLKLFRRTLNFDKTAQDFMLYAIIPNTKYSTFPEEDRTALESINGINISSISIPNPNNPAKQIGAKLIVVRK